MRPRGSVSITVAPQTLGGDVSEWKFDITFTTHSGSLDFDPTAVTRLVDDSGNIYKPLRWEGGPQGGHHREGVLVFGQIKPLPHTVEIKIVNISEVHERSFVWNMK